MSGKMITANRLGDGRVLFLGPHGSWVENLAGGVLFEDGPELEAAGAFAQAQHDAQIVVEPYTIDVVIREGRLVPARLRERIRAEGPTVGYGHAEVARLHGAEVRP